MLGLARRAGMLAMGHDMVLEAVKKRQARLIVFSNDISPRLKKEIGAVIDSRSLNTPCINIDENMDEIHSALGYRAGVMAVKDVNFADRILELLNQEESAYGNKN